MNNNQTPSSRLTKAPHAQDQQEDEWYQGIIDRSIANAIKRINDDPAHAQSEQGKKLLAGLSDPTSPIYADAVRTTHERVIAQIQNKPNPSEADKYILKFLQSKLTEIRSATPSQSQPEQSEVATPKTQPPLLQGDHIPNEVLLQTVEKIILGHTRIDVAKHLIEQEPVPAWLKPIADMDKTEATNLLSQRLRQADPNSNKFSHTKFGEHAKAVKQNAIEALQKRVYELIEKQVKDFETTDAKYAKHIETTEQMIDATQDYTERRQHIKLWMNLNEQRDEKAHVFLTQFHRILNTAKPKD